LGRQTKNHQLSDKKFIVYDLKGKHTKKWTIHFEAWLIIDQFVFRFKFYRYIGADAFPSCYDTYIYQWPAQVYRRNTNKMHGKSWNQQYMPYKTINNHPKV
jgi:hypothetical protein